MSEINGLIRKGIPLQGPVRQLCYFALIWLPSLLLLLGLTLFIYRQETNHQLELLKAEEQETVSHLTDEIGHTIRQIVSDLLFFAENPHTSAVLEGKRGHDLQLFTRNAVSFIERKRVFDQIRLLDRQGRELARIDNYEGEGRPLPTEALQDKSQRYYFQEAWQLSPGEIYLSPFDLNVEHGQIERPLKPVIRIATPVVDDYGNKLGLIIFNFRGKQLIERIRQADRLGHLLMVDSDGFWIVGHRPDEEWGSILPERQQHRFGFGFPTIWERVKVNDRGQQLLGDDLYTFESYYPGRPSTKPFFTNGNGVVTLKNRIVFGLDEKRWSIISHITSDDIQALLAPARKRLTALYLILAAALALISALAARALGLRFEARIALQQSHDQLQEEVQERKQAELSLKAEKREQLNLIDRLEQTQDRLMQADKMASIGQLAAGVAHEINNPIGFINSNLNSLHGYIDGLIAVIHAYGDADETLKAFPAQVEMIEAIKAEVDIGFVMEDVIALLSESKEGTERVKQIVQDLKDFSRTDTKKEYQLSDLHQGIESTLNLAQNEIKYKANVIKEFGALPEVYCCLSQINQVVLNLLVNAAHAIDDRGTIFLRTGMENDQVWIEVEDTGKGIAAEDLKRIFDPFFTTKPVGTGTGLGLSLSYGIVQEHGGEIKVHSEPGVGTRFRIWLPLNSEALTSSIA